MMRIISPHNAASIADRFLALLSALGIQPLNRGQIESEFLSVTELLDVWNQTQSALQIPENVLGTAAGVHDFAAKVLAASALPDFASFRRHLELIGQGTLGQVCRKWSKVIQKTRRESLSSYMSPASLFTAVHMWFGQPGQLKGRQPRRDAGLRAVRWAIAI